VVETKTIMFLRWLGFLAEAEHMRGFARSLEAGNGYHFLGGRTFFFELEFIVWHIEFLSGYSQSLGLYSQHQLQNLRMGKVAKLRHTIMIATKRIMDNFNRHILSSPFPPIPINLITIKMTYYFSSTKWTIFKPNAG